MCASRNIWIVEEPTQLMPKAEAAQELAGNLKGDMPMKSNYQVLEGAHFSSGQCIMQDYDMAVDLTVQGQDTGSSLVTEICQDGRTSPRVEAHQCRYTI